MKTLRNLILVACLFCIAPQILAADGIEEGFGLKLGDVFNPASALSTNAPNVLADKPKEFEYQVASTNVIKPFETLSVQITPTTHKIYRIIARGTKLTTEEKKEVMADLQQKYPYADRATRRISVRDIGTDGDTGIDGKFIPRTTITEAVYTALDLQEIALKERAEEESAK